MLPCYVATMLIALFMDDFMNLGVISKHWDEAMQQFRDVTDSQTNLKNEIGPNTDPCGTPLVTSIQSGKAPLTITLCCLPMRKFLIHFRMLLISRVYILAKRRSCGTVSNAFAKSRNTTSTGKLWLSASIQTSSADSKKFHCGFSIDKSMLLVAKQIVYF